MHSPLWETVGEPTPMDTHSHIYTPSIHLFRCIKTTQFATLLTLARLNEVQRDALN